MGDPGFNYHLDVMGMFRVYLSSGLACKFPDPEMLILDTEPWFTSVGSLFG